MTCSTFTKMERTLKFQNFGMHFWINVLTIFSVLQACHGLQSFREKPSGLQVISSQTAILRCRINNMQGQLQWTKNGFGLGEDLSIPGYPTYEIVGNQQIGEYDLKIEDVQLDDDAEFSCQVSPSGDEPALLASAKLSVLVPPEAPFINSFPNGSTIEVPYKAESITLNCTAANGKPAPKLNWFKNGQLVENEAEYGIIPQDGSKLEDAESKLTIEPKDEDNGAYFTCSASNLASDPQETTVMLSVMHLPGMPRVTGYRDGQVVKTGDTLKLVCVSEGGNPLAQVYWYKNGKELDFSYTIDENRVENEIVFTVQPNDNEAVYRCEASNRVTTSPLFAEFKLTVQFAPESVTITGHQDAKAGESITLSCESAISNPPAAITWFSRGRQITGTSFVSDPSPEGGYVSKSEIKVRLTDQENNVVYQCHATNDALGQTVVDTATLTVMYPPETPTISGYSEGREVTAGKILSLTCTAVGGNPLATLKWNKGTKELQGAVRITGKIVSSQISFILKPDDNLAEYQCSATNPATERPKTDTVKLTVNFPPANLEITTDPEIPRAGQPLTITCKSGTSNPASILTWWSEGRQLQGTEGGVHDASFGGKSTISKLTMTPTALDNGKIYACRATNPLLERAVSDAVTLDVRFVPYFPEDIPKTVKIKEGESMLINVAAIANPATSINYTWYKNGDLIKFGGEDEEENSERKRREIVLEHFVIDGATVNITSAKRSDSGKYTVTATNAEGENSMDLEVDIHYPAEVVIENLESIAEAESTITVDCVAKGNPIKDDTIKWRRNGYDMARAIIEYAAGKSTLMISNVTKGDTGTFTCVADNGVGEPAMANADVIVKFSPEIDRSPALGKAASEKMETGILTCRAAGAPAVAFVWYKGGEVLDVSEVKYRAEEKKTNLVVYETNLHVLNVSQQDYGQYVCLAKNELGEDSRIVNLDGTTKPDMPFNLQLVNATHDSITISWTPGFDGGSKQQFQVRYKKVDTVVQKFINVHPGDASVFTVPDLNLGTEYIMTVRGINNLGEGPFQERPLRVTTSAVLPPEAVEMADEVPLIIILTVSIIGMVLLALNVLLILFFIRRRNKRKFDKDASETVSQANTVEMFNAVPDDTKSYTTYDHSDFYDDHRVYGDEDEMRRFLHPGPPGPPGYPHIDLYGPLPNSVYASPSHPDLAPPYDLQRSFPVGYGSKDPIYLEGGLPDGKRMRLSQPQLHPEEDEEIYADQLRKVQRRVPGTMDKRRSDGTGTPMGSQSMTQLPGSGRQDPPPLPGRNSSRPNLDTPPGMNPPLPSRNYGPEEVPHRSSRYGLNKPPPPPPPGDDQSSQRGHLV